MRCSRCGEPWDLDSIHDEISYQHADELERLRQKYANDPRRYRYNDPFQAQYEKKFFNPAVAEFRAKGCGYFGSRCEETLPSSARSVLNAIAELSGDDVGGPSRGATARASAGESTPRAWTAR